MLIVDIDGVPQSFEPALASAGHAKATPAKQNTMTKTAAQPARISDEPAAEPAYDSPFAFSTDEGEAANGEAPPPPVQHEPDPHTIGHGDVYLAQDPASPEEASGGYSSGFASSVEEDAPVLAPLQEDPPAHHEPEPAAEDANGELDMDAILGFKEPAVSAEPPDFGPPGDPMGLSGYADSEMSQGKDGYLLFKILISGIDSKEMRQSIREVIEDSRFGWNPHELMSRVNKGILVIENVPPVKAVILINRIKRLAVQIRWEQSDIRQMDGNPE